MSEKPLELAVVIPTFCEAENIAPLLEKLATVLRDIPHEIVFVDDDSPDATAERVRAVAVINHQVRIIQRIDRQGLSSACVEGMLASSAPFIAVMDADLQHDETILPVMLAKLKDQELDLVIATRNADGGSMGEFSESRVWLSQLGRRLSEFVCHHEISDPMSGFFLLRRSFLQEVVHNLSAKGFKILVDILASSERRVKIGEVPYRFGKRVHGESKLDILVGIEYLQLLLDKTLGRYMPVRFLLFGMVGAGGAILHLLCVFALYRVWGTSFALAQTVATFIGMTANFFGNNAITYRSLRLRGLRILSGLLTFYAACSIGAFVNLRVAEFLLANSIPWIGAGLVGVGISSIWNYAMTAVFTWRRQQNSRVSRQ